jgi:hypothetical protein
MTGSKLGNHKADVGDRLQTLHNGSRVPELSKSRFTRNSVRNKQQRFNGESPPQSFLAPVCQNAELPIDLLYSKSMGNSMGIRPAGRQGQPCTFHRMQFVADGPEIPENLLLAHEEGRVVFFCGAGISYPAGLPGFKGLVDDIYRCVGTVRTPIEKEAYERNQFDGTLDLLERRIPGQRIAVRKALAQALQPKLRKKGATDTHAALLQLARCREGALRLVTTNFDRVFERVGKRTKRAFSTYAAPMLPIPKNSRWNGLVYLHGLLPDKADDSALHRLVLTSGDFGLAYLTERWAARFVSELFRNYVVCFVGYSINDPVLRYMMDALAADRMLGEVTPQAYALGDCEPGQEHGKTIEWEAKGVTPILYEVPAGSHDHQHPCHLGW